MHPLCEPADGPREQRVVPQPLRSVREAEVCLNVARQIASRPRRAPGWPESRRRPAQVAIRALQLERQPQATGRRLIAASVLWLTSSEPSGSGFSSSSSSKVSCSGCALAPASSSTSSRVRGNGDIAGVVRSVLAFGEYRCCPAMAIDY